MEVFSRWLIVIAGFSGFIAVGLGAFGAHGLKNILDQRESLHVWQTAVQYQFYHAVALLVLGVLVVALQNASSNAMIGTTGLFWVIGTILFSGSLYALALGAPKWMGMITPIGGLCFLIGWGFVVVSGFKWLKS